MRCQYCGSTMIHPDTQHKQFATGKAVAGAVTFGLPGAAAGFIGKDTKGYRCGACGAFAEKAMDISTEMSVDDAIRDAEAGRSRSLYDYFKKQYPNIQANIPAQVSQASHAAAAPVPQPTIPDAVKAAEPSLKQVCQGPAWQPDCPVYVEAILIKSTDQGDALSLRAYNQSGLELRSVYYTAIVYDDTGDKINEVSCVYQNIQTPAGAMLPAEKSFPLGTDLAYRVELVCEKASLAGDTVWRKDAQPGISLEPQPQLTSQTFPRIKYLYGELAKVCSLKEDDPLYLPQEGDGYWQCICGQPVRAGENCPRCGAEIEQIQPLLSQQHLREVQQTVVKRRAAERAKVTMDLYNKARQQSDEKIYLAAISAKCSNDVDALNRAIAQFEKIPGYKDSEKCAEECRKKIAEIEQAQKEQAERKAEAERIAAEKEREERERQQEAERRAKLAAEARKKAIIKIVSVVAIVAVVTVIGINVYQKVIIPQQQYDAAVELLEAGNYDEAVAAFTALGSYKDAAERINEAYYAQAEMLENSGDIRSAVFAFERLGDYQDAAERCLTLWGSLSDRRTIATGTAYTAAIQSDGTAIAIGSNSSKQCDISDWTNLVSISVGSAHTVGLREDGTVLATGENGQHQCDVKGWSQIVAISAGAKHTVGLKADGTVVAAGVQGTAYCDVSDWKDIVAIATGNYHTFGVKSDGTVIVAGQTTSGQCNVTGWENIIAVSAGAGHTVGLRADGTVVATGDNISGQCDVSDWTDIVAVTAGANYTVGLRSDGTVVAVGQNASHQCDVSGWTDIVAISAGYNFTVGLKSDGTVVAVGSNKQGQCDVGDWVDIKVPEK